MSPIMIMDQVGLGMTRGSHTGQLAYRRPDDRQSFWTSKFPTAGPVEAFMCEECGRIALYGGRPDA